MRVQLYPVKRENESYGSFQTLISAFSPCPSCGKLNSMSFSATWGAHSAFKVREKMNSNDSNEKQSSSQSFKKLTCTKNERTVENPDNPTKYNSKAMQAIWGMYNRYSVHNMKANSYDKA